MYNKIRKNKIMKILTVTFEIRFGGRFSAGDTDVNTHQVEHRFPNALHIQHLRYLLLKNTSLTT